jgi:hypothetical protein
MPRAATNRASRGPRRRKISSATRNRRIHRKRQNRPPTRIEKFSAP